MSVPAKLLSEELSKLAPTEAQPVFEQEVENFSAWLERGLPDWKWQGPLTKAERILLLTFLMQKHKGAF